MNTTPLLIILLFLTVFPEGKAQTSGVDHWETVVFSGDVWAYYPGVAEPPTDWIQTDFNDTTWLSGPGSIGYGDGDDRTVIDPVLSVYLRRKFRIQQKSNLAAAILNMDYDDAFVAYLNGVEIARANIGTPGVRPTHDQASTTWHEALLYQGIAPESFPLSPEALDTLLKEGENVLAVEVHNHDIGSSDLTAAPFFTVGVKDTSFTYRTPPSWFKTVEPLSSSNLPLILINTHGQTIPDEPRITADMKVINYGPGLRNHPDDIPNDYNGRIAIEIHGESSTMFPKKSYRLETQDSLGENNNVSLLGMPKENDWILYGPYSDKSLIRNALIYRLSNDIGRYAPRTRFCELLLNGEYMGLYLLTEKIKRDKHRVPIKKLHPEDTQYPGITGGYILRVDKTHPGDYGWTSMPSPMAPNENYIFFQYQYPRYNEMPAVQKQYIRNYILLFESTLNSASFTSPTEGYAKYINTGSFIDHLILNETGKNVDAYIFSVYMYKDVDTAGGKLNMGPLWDFNLAFGNVNYLENSQYAPGWTYQDQYRMYWYRRLMEDPQFVNHLKCRWDTLRQQLLSNDRIQFVIDSLVSVIDEAQVRNFARWPVLGEYVWPNQFIGDTYQEEVTFLRNWIFSRLEWMDNHMPGDCQAWTRIRKQKSSSGMIIYPNPFDRGIHFVFEGLKDPVFTVGIYDLTGRQVALLDGRNSYPDPQGYRLDWNGSALKPGIYLIRAVARDHILYTGKIIKK